MANNSAAQSNTTGLTNNVAGALCYLFGLLSGIAFLVLAPYNSNRSVRFNAFQAIFFSLGLMASSIALPILGMLLPAVVSLILSMAYLLVMLGCLAVWLFVMWKTLQGSTVILPVVGPLAQKYASE